MVGSKSYYHNTQKEDGVNVSSKLLPVIYTLSTEMMWQFGFLDNLFKHIGFDGKLNIGYGKVQKLPRHKYTRVEGMEGFVDTLFKLQHQMRCWMRTWTRVSMQIGMVYLGGSDRR